MGAFRIFIFRSPSIRCRRLCILVRSRWPQSRTGFVLFLVVFHTALMPFSGGAKFFRPTAIRQSALTSYSFPSGLRTVLLPQNLHYAECLSSPDLNTAWSES